MPPHPCARTNRPRRQEQQNALDDDALLGIHRLIWSRAAEQYESGNLQRAAHIYLYSLSFPTRCLPGDQVADVRSNLAWCYLKLGNHVDALKIANELLASLQKPGAPLPTSCLRSCYIAFKVQLSAGEISQAMQHLRVVASAATAAGADLRDGLLGLAVADAHKGHHREVAVLALESLCSDNQHTNDIHLLRCLVRLKLGSFDEDVFRKRWNEVLPHLTLAKDKLQTIYHACQETAKTAAEANWWSTVAWSLGIEACGYDLPGAAAGFFRVCAQLDALVKTPSNQNRRQMCALMHVAASALGLESSRYGALNEAAGATSTAAPATLAPAVTLHSIEQLVGMCRQLVSVADAAKGLDHPTERMLRLYEFHAIANAPTRMDERLVTMANACTRGGVKTVCKLLHTMGDIAKSASRLAVAMHAFQLCATRAMQEDVPDPGDSKAAVRALRERLQIACTLEKYDIALDAAEAILGVHAKQPCTTDQDMRWILTHLWNQGVELYSRQNTVLAVKLGTVAVSFLKHLSASLQALLSPKLTQGMCVICGNADDTSATLQPSTMAC